MGIDLRGKKHSGEKHGGRVGYGGGRGRSYRIANPLGLAHNNVSYPLLRGSASAWIGFLREVWLSQQFSMLGARCVHQDPHTYPAPYWYLIARALKKRWVAGSEGSACTMPLSISGWSLPGLLPLAPFQDTWGSCHLPSLAKSSSSCPLTLCLL